ncbi:MAG: hypothetical protein O2821_06645 [Chloroflexi bacterium]|nr:hypothetical protein [Chloroflexota bacterium]MDA1227930.1 hypothetical protein [Chloroflexota bacterium]
MPLIKQIMADDPRLPPMERQVLDIMEKHPEYLFRKDKKADLQELRAWMQAPHTPEPPLSLIDSNVQPISILEHTLVSLHHKQVIGCLRINQYQCYGSHAAILSAKASLTAEGMDIVELLPSEASDPDNNGLELAV